MVFQVPASKRSIKQNQFEFKVPGDKRTYSIPKAKYLPMGVVERMSSAEQVTLTDIIALFGDPESPAAVAVRTLDGEQITALTEAWQKDSGVQAGESSASTRS